MKYSLATIRKGVTGSARNWRGILTDIRNKLFTGVVVAIPVVVTIWVLKLAYTFISGISAPFLNRFGITLPGSGFLVTLIILLGLGFMATNVLGQRILESLEKLLLRVPVVATIYTGVKQVIDSFKSFNNVANFKRVVYVEYPAEGAWLVGLVTGQFYDASFGHEMTTVVIPTAPNPMTGLILVVESTKLRECDMSLEEAMKMIVSAGLVAPKRKPGLSGPDLGAPLARETTFPPTVVSEEMEVRQGR